MGAIQLFVSHASQDADLALALVEIVDAAMEVPEHAILCTSAPGRGLLPGVDVSDHLRQHLTQAACVVAMLTPYSLSSKWCLFELGGAWARATHTYPLLAGGLTEKDLPAALQGKLGGQLREPGDIHNLLDDLSRRLGWLPVPDKDLAGRLIDQLVKVIHARRSSTDDVDGELFASFIAKMDFIDDAQRGILRHIVRSGRGMGPIPHAELQRAFPSLSGLHYCLMQLRYLHFLTRCPMGETSGGVPQYAWTLSPEYAKEVWK